MHCAEEALSALGIKFLKKKEIHRSISLFAPFPIPKCSTLSFISWKSIELSFSLQFQEYKHTCSLRSEGFLLMAVP